MYLSLFGYTSFYRILWEEAWKQKANNFVFVDVTVNSLNKSFEASTVH